MGTAFSIFVFLVFLITIIIVTTIIFSIKFSRLENEITELKRHLPKTESTEVEQDSVQSGKTISTHDIGNELRRTEGPEYGHRLLVWLKTDWLMKLGALFVLLAIIWFVRYAILENWIGEMGRVAMGLVISTLIMAFGFVQLNKRKIPAQVLMAIGTVGVLATVYAARNYYDIFTPEMAMAIMCFVVIMVTIVSVINNSMSLAFTGILGGMIAPILINSNTENYLFLNFYILLLNCGVFTVMALKGWRILLPFAVIVTGIYSVNTFNAGNLAPAGTWLLMSLYYALFFIGIFAGVLYSKNLTKEDALSTVMTVLLGIYWVNEYVPKEWQSMAISLAMIFAGIVTVIALKLNAPKKIAYISGASAIGLLGAATAYQLSDQSLVVALLVEAIGIIIIVRYILADIKATLATSLILLIPVILSIPSFDLWRNDEIVANTFALLSCGVGLLVAGIITKSLTHLTDKKNQKENIRNVQIGEFIGSTLFGIILVWRLIEALISSQSIAHGTALVIYTVSALTAFFIGRSQNKKVLKFSGLAVLAGVILRLSLVEAWDMSLTARTITFVVIGLLLITTAFFQKKQNIIN